MIKKFFIFKEALDEKNTNSPKLQKLVDEANSLLTQIYNKHGEGAHIESEYAVFQVDPITYINGVITIEYGTGYNYKKDREKEVYSLEYDAEKGIISSLKSWIKLFKKNVFNESEEGRNKYFTKIKYLVEQLNILIRIAYDKNNYKIGIYDTSSTWQKEEFYLPIEHEFGKKVVIKHDDNESIYNLDINTSRELEDLIKDLEYLIKQYTKFIKKEGIYPLTPKDLDNLKKLVTELDSLENNTNYIKLVNIPGINPFFVNQAPYKDVIDEDLKKYFIPGIYLRQDNEHIKIFISYFNIVYILMHEQYLSKIYRIYKSIKN
jgi:hypothetical protein